MNKWAYSHDGYAATLDTQFAQLRITPDIAHSTPEAIYYRAQVCSRRLDTIRECSDIATMDAAQAWCLTQYRELLAVELEAIE